MFTASNDVAITNAELQLITVSIMNVDRIRNSAVSAVVMYEMFLIIFVILNAFFRVVLDFGN